MNILLKTLLQASLLFGSIGSAWAQAANPVASAADSAASAASSAASAASSEKSAKQSAEAAAAKFDLPVGIAVGDRIRLRSKVSGLVSLNSAKGSKAGLDTCLRVIRLNDSAGITVAVEEADGKFRGSCALEAGADLVEAGGSYTLTREQLKNASYSRYGWVYGPMVVPFKFFSHDRSFEPSQSLGMYMGYRTSWFESRGLSWVASAGLATMKVSQVADDPNEPGNKITKESTVAGFSVAGGVLFDLTQEAKPFVAGLLIGRDFVGRNSALTYKHDNRTWIALQIGWVQ